MRIAIAVHKGPARREESNLSYAEQQYRARLKEGKLFPEEWETLCSDVIAVLDGKNHPKDYDEIKSRLVKFCGWSRDKLSGPRHYLANCLWYLVDTGLIQADELIEDWYDTKKNYWK
jgi:hypothetical protein